MGYLTDGFLLRGRFIARGLNQINNSFANFESLRGVAKSY